MLFELSQSRLNVVLTSGQSPKWQCCYPMRTDLNSLELHRKKLISNNLTLTLVIHCTCIVSLILIAVNDAGSLAGGMFMLVLWNWSLHILVSVT